MKKHLAPSHFFLLTILSCLAQQGTSHAQTHFIYGAEGAEQINLSANGVFYLSLNSFKDKSKAYQYYDQLRSKGFNLTLIKYSHQFYHVYMGPFYSAAEVRKIGYLLKQSSSAHPILPHQPISRTQPIHTNHSMRNTYNPVYKIGSPKKSEDFSSSFSISAGGFYSSLGHQQTINIQHVIGEEYTKTSTHNGNALIGLSYDVEVPEYNPENLKIRYGVKANYFGKTSVKGDILQEKLFKNLSYSFNVENIPVYATIKAIYDIPNHDYGITADAGIGPNFMKTSGYNETIIYADSLRDNPFSGQTTTTFSATFGIGLQMKHLLEQYPLECGYHFYYLGEGKFQVNSSQILNQLNTGQIYANALTCSISN